ncbi:hypothetical protein ACTXT7_006950 [Hymenolepis weldensis]
MEGTRGPVGPEQWVRGDEISQINNNNSANQDARNGIKNHPHELLVQAPVVNSPGAHTHVTQSELPAV